MKGFESSPPTCFCASTAIMRSSRPASVCGRSITRMRKPSPALSLNPRNARRAKRRCFFFLRLHPRRVNGHVEAPSVPRKSRHGRPAPIRSGLNGGDEITRIAQLQ